MSKLNAYRRSFVSAFTQAGFDRAALYRSILYGVRIVNLASGKSEVSTLTLSQTVLALMAKLTPRELTVISPITKEYDGKRLETKDYFSTAEMIEQHGWDELISEPFEFLWDYMNSDICKFVVHYMSSISDLRRSQGLPGLLEEWSADKGIPLYRMHTSPDGKQYMMDESGRSTPVKKKRPRYLKLIPGARLRS